MKNNGWCWLTGQPPHGLSLQDLRPWVTVTSIKRFCSVIKKNQLANKGRDEAPFYDDGSESDFSTTNSIQVRSFAVYRFLGQTAF